jgi:hypothetical protein
MREWLPLAELLLVLGTVLVLARPDAPRPPPEPPDRSVN